MTLEQHIQSVDNKIARDIIAAAICRVDSDSGYDMLMRVMLRLNQIHIGG